MTTWSRKLGSFAQTGLLAFFFVALGGFSGCARDDSSTLVVATTWNSADRASMEEQFRKTSPQIKIRWILLAEGEDASRIAARRLGPDILLGGPMMMFGRLENDGLLDNGADSPPWRFSGHGEVVGGSDPRRDPWSLSRARDLLAEDWESGYAWLVREGAAPSGPTSRRMRRDDDCVGILRRARHLGTARAFLKDFPGTSMPPLQDQTASNVDTLLAILLRAVLVDADEERVAAWSALEKAGHPEKAEHWMTRPPPWPPSSVASLLSRESNAMELVDTLAAQIAPDARIRSWLVRSWLAPERRVDLALMAELSSAADNTLAQEPRFRSWLRSEWGAWARQRYRRVARLAIEGTAP
jgi:hypothetical protein